MWASRTLTGRKRAPVSGAAFPQDAHYQLAQVPDAHARLRQCRFHEKLRLTRSSSWDVTHWCIAAILVLGPALDANYSAIKLAPCIQAPRG
jgi:hypothetical protein